MLFGFKLKVLFFEPTENGFIKFFRYCFVGGIAFVVDYCAFSVVCMLLGKSDFITAAATTAGFICGLAVNFILSKKIVFTENSKYNSVKGEFLGYTIIGVIGWIINVLMMLIFTSWILNINSYIAKIVVALIVLVYNYIARKAILYSK